MPFHTMPYIPYHLQDGGGDDDDARENLSACNHRIDELRAKLDELTQKHNEQVWYGMVSIVDKRGRKNCNML